MFRVLSTADAPLTSLVYTALIGGLVGGAVAPLFRAPPGDQDGLD